MIKIRLLILITAVGGLLLYSCGYKFAGSGELPSSVKRVSISVLENKTAESGIENIITNDIIYEFNRHGKNVVRKDEADAFLTGVIDTATDVAISRSSTIASLERRVVINISLKLKGKDGNIIWTGSNITDDQAFTVLTDKIATENEMRKAIEILSKRLAEKVYNKLTDNF
ncbi:MAG: hypothetical protein KJ826_18905 [Proteobacteria bacterium]|nr:hypothetical protein [Pseudomonadota bacterium]